MYCRVFASSIHLFVLFYLCCGGWSQVQHLALYQADQKSVFYVSIAGSIKNSTVLHCSIFRRRRHACKLRIFCMEIPQISTAKAWADNISGRVLVGYKSATHEPQKQGSKCVALLARSLHEATTTTFCLFKNIYNHCLLLLAQSQQSKCRVTPFCSRLYIVSITRFDFPPVP